MTTSRLLALLSLFALFSARTSAQTVEDRITAILNQMSMDEKIKQLHAEGGYNTGNNARLGIPGFIMADGPHGVRDGMATSFPVGIGMASTWDVELAQRVGVAMGKEFRGKGKHQALGPCLDIDRDPRNGRSPETGGEDPYLCAQTTSRVVRGIQSTPCIATTKHYNCNHRENERTQNNIIASQRLLHEQAGLAFRTGVQQGGVFCVMNAYNLINGEKCAENSNLLTTILRTHWGFPYYVVSDWGSIWNSEKAIKAGCDICMGSANYENDLPGLVSQGAVPDSVIDAAVRRVLRTKMLAGMLDYQPPGNPDDVNCVEHQQLCLEAGRKSLVLLKNQDSILPLSKSIMNYVALVGPSAAVAQIDGTGSSYVTPYYRVSPMQGVESEVGVSNVKYAKGCDINSADTTGFSEALNIAQNADAVVYCGGLDPTQEGEGLDRVGGSINLPGKQQDLINRLAAVNPRLVVVLFSGGICGISRCIDNVKGLIYAFYPGQEGGNAVAEVLFGDYNPGGKLAVTMPKDDAQLPPWNDNLNDDYGGGYRWFDQMGLSPQYVFGFGLSYTTFAYSNLTISPTLAAPGQPISVTVDVTNTGTRSGDEVAQLYLSCVTSSVARPVKELKGFKRITLAPGQTSTVSFVLTADELYYFNEATSSYEVEAGQYTVRIGGSSDNLPLTGSFYVLDGPRKPDLLITSLKMVPPYPLPGQKVVFLATVKNQGSAATTAGSPLKLSFTLNGREVSWSDEFTGSIPAGGMALVCGNRGSNGINTWTADTVGSYTVTAQVDPDNSIDECVETNNSFTAELTVYPKPLENLALNKAATASSIEGPGLEASKAVDGDMGTRWSSAFSDPQWIYVDLGAIYHIDEVVLNWETAYAKQYFLQISDSASGWNNIWQETNGDGGIDRIHVSANGRFLRMLGTERATAWGYSLYEIEVYGSSTTAVVSPEKTSERPVSCYLYENFPNPFNPSTTIKYGLPRAYHVKLMVYNVLGELLATLVDHVEDPGYHAVPFNASGLASGVYIYRLQVSTPSGQAGTLPTDSRQVFLATKKMLLLK
jgi:beta-glucosidase